MRTFWNDIRYGFRLLAANPGFSAVAILSLAIGIGANTSMFSFADAMLLRPMPVERPGEIVRVVSTSPNERYGSISYPDFLDLQNSVKSLSGLIGSRNIAVGLNANPNSPALFEIGSAVTANFFDVIGVHPALGRGFRGDEDREPVVVISDSLWKTQFGADPSVVGRSVKISKADFTVIGVAPESFPGLDRFVHEALFVPMGAIRRLALDDPNPLGHRDRLNLFVYGRLQPGYTAAQAQAELQSIAHNLERAYPDTNRGRSILAMPELEARLKISTDDAMMVSLLLVVAGMVLLIACANVVSLLLSRARARSREIAIRLAIGAGRGRLLRQLLTESLVLAFAGGIAGLGLAVLGVRFLSSLRFPTTLPLSLVAHLDMRVLLFCAGASLLSGLIFGLAPALQTMRAELTTALKSGDAAPSGKKRRLHVRNLLVVSQVAVSMVLLVASGLLVKDFAKVSTSKAGFRTDHILVMTLDPSMVGNHEAQGRTFYRQVVERVRTLPGVRAAALGEHIPLGLTSSQKHILVDGYEMAKGQQLLTVLSDVIDENYLAMLQIPVIAGRSFASTDTATSPAVAIVNEAMAITYWPKGNAIGGRIHFDNQTVEVVGIAKTIKYRDLTETPQPFLYLPFSQQYSSLMALHVETSGDPASLTAPVLSQIRQLDPTTPVTDVQTLQHFFQEGALFGNRLVTEIVTTIGLFGLLLAITGLYGVIAYAVSRRTREIGIRMAIGAAPSSVARMVLRQGMILTVTGAVIGLALAALASQALSSQLVGISAYDPAVYVLVPLLLAVISALACYIPARRAARIDPLLALRQD